MKTCNRCNQLYSLSNFGKHPLSKDKLKYWCKNCVRSYQKENYSKWAKHRCEYANSYYKKNKKFALEYASKYRKQLRQKALEFYGGITPKCKCCNEKHVEFLEIDHINNDGAAHRKKIGGSMNMFRWLRDNNYPLGFQVLCRNCNLAKAFYGQCPHKKKNI